MRGTRLQKLTSETRSLETMCQRTRLKLGYGLSKPGCKVLSEGKSSDCIRSDLQRRYRQCMRVVRYSVFEHKRQVSLK